MKPAILLLLTLNAFITLHAADAPMAVIAPPAETCSAPLPDGRSFVSGGRNANGPVALAGYFGKDGSLTPVPPMLEARASHVCVSLPDGSILVAGGATSGAGSTNSAEIFHPATSTWSSTAAMLTARMGAAGILLKNGKILVAGGEVAGRTANTLEVYDPDARSFEQARGILTAARARHAAALLDDGRVVIAGGFENGQPLDSVDLYDPSEGVVTPAGRMSGARANFTATPLGGSQVLFAGGTDGSSELSSAEVFDASRGAGTQTEPLSAARQRHIAIRAGAAGQVLICGGSVRGRMVDTCDSFALASRTFRVMTESAPGDAPGVVITVGILTSDGRVVRRKSFTLGRESR